MKNKTALITGITGQDGSYLAELLLSKNYKVVGLKRRTSLFNTSRIDHLYVDPLEKKTNFELYHSDMNDGSSITNIINKVKPDEIYNLAAQSHVKVSFEIPEYTANSDALGTLRILEAIRSSNRSKNIKFYQASTSEMYGNCKKTPQNEKTVFDPDSPYAAAKLYAHNITRIYREAYGIYACAGILFNHESPRRGETFVTKKIVKGLAEIKLGVKKKLSLGNLNSKRDWGHAKDYVQGMWKIMQHKQPDDFVLATGKQITIREFVVKCLKFFKFKYKFIGKGLDEKVIDENKKVLIDIDKKYFRPLDVENLKGDSSKARKILKWKPKYNIDDLVKEMCLYEIENLKRNIND
jgi:GDPmannose 4,6-dehydratase